MTWFSRPYTERSNQPKALLSESAAKDVRG
jgi:hypothetical protein